MEIEIIADLIVQAIRPGKDGWRFSGYIGAYAEAMRFLAQKGIVEINDCGGRCVSARFLGDWAIYNGN